MHQAAAANIEAQSVSAHESALGMVQAERVQLQNSGAAVVRAQEIQVDGFAGAVVAERAVLGNTYAGVVVAQEVQGERIESLLLLGGRVDGVVTTIVDTRGALIAGMTAGLFGGMIYLLGRALFNRKS